MKLQRTAIIILVSAAVLAVCASIYTNIHFSRMLPRRPDAQAGRVEKLSVNHGVIVYASPSEYRFRSLTQYAVAAGALCFGLALLINEKYRLF